MTGLAESLSTGKKYVFKAETSLPMWMDVKLNGSSTLPDGSICRVMVGWYVLDTDQPAIRKRSTNFHRIEGYRDCGAEVA